MKKLFIILITSIALHLSGYAQGVRFGIVAGAPISNFDVKTNDFLPNTKTMTGFTAGVIVDLPLGSSFSLQPGLNYVQKGTRIEQTSDGQTLQAKMSVNNLELPLNFLFNVPTSAGNFFIGAGPSISYALSGKVRVTDGTNTISKTLSFGTTSEDDMRRYDFGANFTAGFTLKRGLLLAANYNAGLSNLEPQTTDGIKTSSHYFGIKLGYMFGGSGKK